MLPAIILENQDKAKAQSVSCDVPGQCCFTKTDCDFCGSQGDVRQRGSEREEEMDDGEVNDEKRRSRQRVPSPFARRHLAAGQSYRYHDVRESMVDSRRGLVLAPQVWKEDHVAD